jgi:hypothetical protein
MKTNKNLSLLIFLSTVSIISIFVGLASNWAFGYKLYIGLSLLGSCFVLYFLNLQRFKSFFGILLILGVFNIIQFVPFGFGIYFILFPFEVLPTFFLLLFIYINKSQVLDLIQDWFTTSEEEKIKSSNSKYESFKNDFQKLSDSEIENRLNQNIVSEARKALMEIKEERNT